MRRVVRGAIAGLVGIGVAASSLAVAAQPKVESTSQFLSRANGICRLATHDLNNALKYNGRNISALAKTAGAIGRVFIWESGAFRRLPGTPSAVHSGYNHLAPFYQDAGQTMIKAASSFSGDSLQRAQHEMNLGLKYHTEADDLAGRLGISACSTAKRTVGSTETFTHLELTQELDSTGTYDVLSVLVDTGGPGEVRGLPITFTVTNGTTGRRLTTFSGTSGSLKFCTIVSSTNGADTVTTYSGRAVAPYAGCKLRSVSIPAADAAVITVRFAGNSKLAPSADTSGQAL